MCRESRIKELERLYDLRSQMKIGKDPITKKIRDLENRASRDGTICAGYDLFCKSPLRAELFILDGEFVCSKACREDIYREFGLEE